MKESIFEQELKKIVDPLDEETRKVRKALLTWSVIAVAVTLGGLFPTSITMLGLTVDTKNKIVLLSMLTLVLAYFFFSFVVYGLADLAKWSLRFRQTEWEERSHSVEAYRAATLAKKGLTQEEIDEFDLIERSLGNDWRNGEASRRYHRLTWAVPKLSMARIFLELFVPTVIGVIGLCVLGIELAALIWPSRFMSPWA